MNAAAAAVGSTITLKELMRRLVESGRPATLLGVGPVSELVVTATVEACRDRECPPMFIASRNQVDKESFGGGYLMGGMNQEKFVRLITERAAGAGYSGPIYICRDHGGPWQRDRELNERLPVGEAIAIAKESFAADIEAGFNDLHIDPTKCPHEFTMADLCRWTLELLEFCEQTRRAAGRPAIDYEIGAEDIQGGITTRDRFEEFLRIIMKETAQRNLPAPTFVVGQTGTLTKMDRNVGKFDRRMAGDLARVSAEYGIRFKEHNADYLSAPTCRIHPELGIGGINVAPEFGLVETSSLLQLAEQEAKLVREGWIEQDTSSNLRELLEEKTLSGAPWQKWADQEMKAIPAAAIVSDRFYRASIARVCGHYVFNDPDFVSAKRKLFHNIDTFGAISTTAEAFVRAGVKGAIVAYLDNLNLVNVNELARQR